MVLLGCDFSSAPTRRKPIVVAFGSVNDQTVTLSRLETFDSLEAWADRLYELPQWLGAFDFPFGLPRELVEQLRWPLVWEECIACFAALSRPEIRRTFAAFCSGRPAGGKFAHRATDIPAGSSPSMKWVNPPVAFMLHAGVPRLIAAGAKLPGLHLPAAGSQRIALEGYPGLLARELIGRRSYKSDRPAEASAERDLARSDLVAGLEKGSAQLQLRLSVEQALRAELLSDHKGDRVDAALCLMQSAWGAMRRESEGPGYGLPVSMDPLEGWIVSA